MRDEYITHVLKSWPGSFNNIINQTKRFEVRFNDRNYKSGQHLKLEEFVPDNINQDHPDGNYTGKWCEVRVDYIMDKSPALKDGYIIMSVKLIKYGECNFERIV